MTIFSTPEFKVGALVLIVTGLIAAMSLKVSENPSYLGTSKTSWFLLDDASGLIKKSNVKMAGINVGIIEDISLQNGEARVDMTLKADVPLTRSARIEIRPNGILGDKHVEIIAGDPRDPPLRSGEQILVVDDRASVDRLIGEVSKITKSLSTVAENIKSATEGDADKPLGRIISNIEEMTGDLAQLTRERKGQVGDIIQSLNNITKTVDGLVNDPGQDGFKAAWKDALHSLRRIETSLKNVEEITDKVNRGEGTIGKLINDETTVEELNTAISGVNNLLDTAGKMQTSFDFHSDYITNTALTKSTLGITIQPGLDRYYEIGIVDDPRGVVESTQTTTTSAGGQSEITEDKRFKNRVRFNALFAKNFYNFSIKGGVMESSGGVGFDYYFWKRRFRASLEAFDFADLHMRASMRYSVFRGIYVTGGADDFTAKDRNASAFVGAGLFLTNDDLKLLMARMPF
ncbi:MAG: MlaD family protein [Bdellovibrionaceae bacterium]|nr:MlaD family protein [Pseudobdellovibrionaceae bacterium]